MRLSDVLSKPITTDYVQIEGFWAVGSLKPEILKNSGR